MIQRWNELFRHYGSVSCDFTGTPECSKRFDDRLCVAVCAKCAK